MRLTLATYNIHQCRGLDGRYDPDRILGVLLELNADVIGLQEVNSREHRGLELLAWFAETTKLHSIAGPTLLQDPWHYGNALLTRCPVTELRRMT